jgi:hypothetical protein
MHNRIAAGKMTVEILVADIGVDELHLRGGNARRRAVDAYNRIYVGSCEQAAHDQCTELARSPGDGGLAQRELSRSA